MLILASITLICILIYLLYPFLLMLYPEQQAVDTIDNSTIDRVSLIYLSQNGEAYIEKKINFLLEELSAFRHSELIVIDDYSTDHTREILQLFEGKKNITIVIKPEIGGIPHSMNMAVRLAKFEYLVFCDQRQCLSKHIIQKLLLPFKDEAVGAVSSCISRRDKNNNLSLLRAYENFIKTQEGRSGNLIGVYGPLFAVKRSCYIDIPENTILDDLYLSLQILIKSKVCFTRECKIYDEDPTVLYDYGRANRYLKGFIQLFFQKELLKALGKRQLVMLIWHKYFRLIIPILLFSCFLYLGILSFGSNMYLIIFLCLSAFLILSVLTGFLGFRLRIFSILRINLYYFLSIIQITYKHYAKRLLSNITPKP